MNKPRSTPQHNRYFAMIERAFDQWPEAHDFAPADSEHLRKWLQCKAGYYIATDIALPPHKNQRAIAKIVVAAVTAAFNSVGEHAWVKENAKGNSIRVFRSKSIAYDKLKHLEACALFNAVAEIIEIETGVSADKLMKEHAA